jgi:hypothetical protein
MLQAAAEREHNEFALAAKSRGTDIPFINPPLDEEEEKAAELDDAAVAARARRAMEKRSAKVRERNG